LSQIWNVNAHARLFDGTGVDGAVRERRPTLTKHLSLVMDFDHTHIRNKVVRKKARAVKRIFHSRKQTQFDGRCRRAVSSGIERLFEVVHQR
jgi:hypothetical protein